MIPNILLNKLENTFAPLAMRIQGVRDVLVREEGPKSPVAQETSFVVQVLIDDHRFAETSAVVLAVFNAFLEGRVSELSVTLRMRPLRIEHLRLALGYGSEWHPCVKSGGSDEAE